MDMTESAFKRSGLYIGLLVFVMGLVLMGLSGMAMAQGSAEKYKVDPSIVCMVNDAVMGKPQIPIVVKGKTYYGCCKNCVGKLNGDPAIRAAEDPFTGKTVDKSGAFILEGPDGVALYFESALTASKFVDSFSKK